jgi:hypothetical protein
MTSTRHDNAFEREFAALADALRGQFHVHRELGGSVKLPRRGSAPDSGSGRTRDAGL